MRTRGIFRGDGGRFEADTGNFRRAFWRHFFGVLLPFTFLLSTVRSPKSPSPVLTMSDAPPSTAATPASGAPVKYGRGRPKKGEVRPPRGPRVRTRKRKAPASEAANESADASGPEVLIASGTAATAISDIAAAVQQATAPREEPNIAQQIFSVVVPTQPPMVTADEQTSGLPDTPGGAPQKYRRGRPRKGEVRPPKPPKASRSPKPKNMSPGERPAKKPKEKKDTSEAPEVSNRHFPL